MFGAFWFRDTKFAGWKAGGGTYTLTAGHHTAIVSKISPDGRSIAVLHSNWSGKKTVGEAVFTLTDLQEGWVKIYRPEEKE